jgi:hypothetical protein
MKENPKPCGCLMGFKKNKNKIKEFWNIFGHHWMILSIQKKYVIHPGYCRLLHGCRSSLFAGLGSSSSSIHFWLSHIFP